MPEFPSMCRNCTAYCPIVVTVEDGKAVKVIGDRDAPAFGGYICPKGRELPAQHNHPDRILSCRTRQADGSFTDIPSDQAISRIAETIEDIRRRYGPRSVAVYFGTGNVTNCNGSAMARSWMNAIGSKMLFSATTIDKPAANVSLALHGNWIAGTHTFETSDTWMIVGANPVIAKSNGAPFNNPGQCLKDAERRGMNLIVIDPRKTETSRRAKLHLQGLPGEDPAILAGMIRVIIEENLFDQAFVAENAEGLDALRSAVAPFTPDYVAERAGLPATLIVEAAQLFAAGKRGGVVCATGPSFSTNSNLTFYLALCLNTMCGRWVRAGEVAPYPNVLLPSFVPKAQPYPPYPAVGDFPMRVLGLKEAASGMPTAALADEILTPGEGQVRALICLGGNPMLSWPDQGKVEAALRSLDILVVLDHQMTATAKLADYVIGCPLSLETAGSTFRIEALKYIGVSRGYSFPWAHYAPKIVDPPKGSDLVEDSQFFFRLAQKMNLKLNWTNSYGYGKHVETPPQTVPLDMSRIPTIDDLLELSCVQSRIPLDEVKRYPRGHIFPQEILVQPRDTDCRARLQLGDPQMMTEVANIASEQPSDKNDSALLLISRRINTVMNSVGQSIPALSRGMRFAPAFMHPHDIKARELVPGDLVKIRSAHAEMVAELESDDSLREGVISVIHGFELPAATQQRSRNLPSTSVTSIISMDEADPISGIPRMSALPVEVTRFEMERPN